MTVIRQCTKCGTKTLVRRVLNTEGMHFFIWYCPGCKDNASPDDAVIPESLIVEWQRLGRFPGNIEDVPLVDLSKVGVCAVCGSETNVYPFTLIPHQLREFVPNYADWPAFSLCQSCTDQWFKVVCWYIQPDTPGDERVRAKYERIVKWEPI